MGQESYASSEGFAELGLQVVDMRGLRLFGLMRGAGATESVVDQLLGLADGEVLTLDTGGQAELLGAFWDAQEGSGMAHGECST